VITIRGRVEATFRSSNIRLSCSVLDASGKIPLDPDIEIVTCTLLSAKSERLDDLESRFQADLDTICETFNVERRSRKFEKWRTTP
jgi:hypothetical protein